MQYGKVTYTLTEALSVRNRSEIGKKLGVSRQAVEHWDNTGRLPAVKALALHFDHGVPWDVLKPLVEGRS